MTLTQQEMDEALAVALAKQEDQIATLTAQNEALVRAMGSLRDECFDASGNLHDEINCDWLADFVTDALSLTPADALERVKRDAEERRLMEAVTKDLPNLLCHVSQLLDGWHQDGTAWSEWDESVRKRVSEVLAFAYALDNFRKGAGR